ncbi:MAG: hypothetical protein M1820_003356 [Bogoriella megaspora]|nr:MAG: hypothetical protein M1820_003356 [Bogoriella megaspora]
MIQQWSSLSFQRRLYSDEAKPTEAATTDETIPEPPSKAEEDVIAETSAQASEATESVPQPETAHHAASETTDAAEDVEAPRSTFESAQQTAEDVANSASQTAQQAGQTVAQTAEQIGEVAGAAVGGAAGAASARSPFHQAPRSPFTQNRANPTQGPAPSRILYIGNLHFEVREDTLRREFSRFGNISNCRIVYDNRGLSKGFGYVELDSVEAAEAAIRGMDQQVLEGRRMAVQFHIQREPRRTAATNLSTPRPPSKTLFIGNMSFEMSDRDLNDLFRDIRNVLDVRVAIDRRSGQPRGFAHADFVDIPSAQRAMEVLQAKEIYGRKLRVDFSGESRQSRVQQ